MPELPEVETVKRQLSPIIKGKRVLDVQINDTKLGQLPAFPFSEASISSVSRLGKQIVVTFNREHSSPPSASAFHLVVHLRMTGRLLWQSNQSTVKTIPAFQYVNETQRQESHPSKPPRAEIMFEDGRLEFHDTRRFGTFDFTSDLTPFKPKGIDPVTDQLDPKQMSAMVRKTKQSIKQFLLRQDRLVGLGNIYVCEILFRSKIHPERITNTLSPNQIQTLIEVTPKILNQAIEECGTTFSDFQHADGNQGSFQNFLNVYQKQGQPCCICNAPIQRISQQGRSSFFCPTCQK